MSVRIRVIRPDDLLHLMVEAFNMRLDLTDPAAPVLVVDEPQLEAYLVVGFPPQAVVEEAVFEQRMPPIAAPEPSTPFKRPTPTATSKSAPEGVLASRISGPSRLVFSVPADARIPYTLAGLLDWPALETRLAPAAAAPEHPTPEQADQVGGIVEPEPGFTAVELPYRLLISPTPDGRWIHRDAPYSHAGRTELWHTRLGRITPLGPVPASRAHPLPLRAIWSPDYPNPPAMGDPDQDWRLPGGVLTSMTPRDRHEIVVLTSGFRGYLKGYNPWPTVDQNRFEPSPVYADNLMLTALGGSLTSRGAWSPPMPWLRFSPRIGQIVQRPGPSLNVSEWVHHAVQGRDQYVRIVYEGVVHPFGHRASLIKVTERKIRKRASDGSPVAFLAQRMYVVIRQPVMDYTADRDADPTYARRMPFRRVRLTTLITPDIQQPVKIKKAGGALTDAFWVTVDGRFRFNAVAEDLLGRSIDFSTTLVFIPFSSLADTAALEAVRADHLKAGADRACPVPGQPVTFAEPLVGAPTDNTTQVTEQLHFATEVIGAGTTLRFRPTLLTAFVRLPAVEQLLGVNARAQITLRKEYVDAGFEATASGLFAVISTETAPGTFTQATLGAAFSADQAGGVATPNLSVTALTREHGAVAGKDLGQLASGTFDPAEFFADVAANAKLFGTFALTDLLEGGSLADGAPKVQMTTDTSDAAHPKLVATLTFTPAVRGLTVGIASFQPNGGSKLTVTGRVERIIVAPGLPAPAPVSEFSGQLTDFVVSLANVVMVNFQTFSFHAASGSKPSVDVALKPDPVGFAGDLEFVNTLKEIIPPGLFGAGASLDVTSTGIRAGFGIGLPPVSLGVFSLESVNLAAAVELPFADGKPLFDFAVSSREHPFCLTVAFLGGGGFFHLQIDTDGVLMLEAALEFGASASIDLGVASGGVHIMAGIYFAMGTKNGVDFAILSGYLRMGGELSVLGLISISLEFVLSFGYESGKAAGRATLTVKVEVAFFSTSVKISVEKKFGGSSGDPRFADVIESPSVWSSYASAFA